ncbi:MAG: TolC family protein [Robiginitomaculum sp.]|nr:TolC family protein [Robiginitomaculum sp.]
MNTKTSVLSCTVWTVCTGVVMLMTSVAPGAVAQTPTTDTYPELITLTPASSRNFISTETVKRPNVASFVQSAMTGHPALQAAQAALEAEKARARGMGRKLYNPELEVDLETASTEIATIGLSQTLDRHKKRKVLQDAGRDNVFAAQAAVELVKKTLQTELLTALSEYQINHDMVALAESKVAFSRDFLKLAERRKAAGDLSSSEVLTARLSLAGSLADLARAKSEQSRAAQTLTTLTGTQLERWPLLRGTPNGQSARNWLANPESFPEIRLASAQSRAFRSRIAVARKMRKTDPTVGGRIGLEGSNALFGVSLAIPLQINNKYYDSIDVAKAESLEAEAGLARIRRQTIARLKGTERRFADAERAWQDWQSSGALQLDTQRSLLKQLWEAGELNAVNYLIQFDQTFDAQSASAELKAAYWRSWFERLDASNLIPQWLETIQ